MQLEQALTLAAALWLWGCAATSNPEPGAVPPAAPRPDASPAAGESNKAPGAPAAAASASGTPAPEGQGAPASAATGPQSASVEKPSQDPSATPRRLSVGSVGGEAIDVRDFLSRLWMRDSERAREVFEYLVMSRIALLEADRLGVRIDPRLADATVERAWTALGERLEKSGSKLSIDQHIERTLEMDKAAYERKLRADAIIQLLTERCVRAWYLANPRVELRLMELEDEPALAAALQALDAGTTFEEVARAHGQDVDAAQGGTRMTVVRSESSELARLAFSTAVGETGGPLVQGGRFLLLRPEARLEAVEGSWTEVGSQVEESLRSTPIDSDRLEFAQWRAAMMRRYPIDLGPFLELVKDSAP